MKPLVWLLVLALGGCTWDWDRFEGLAPAGAPGRWESTFHDDCDGSAVDRARWNTQYYRKGLFRWYDWSGSQVDDANVEVADGVCRIKIENRRSGTVPYTSGVLDSGGKWEQTYGFFEARLKAARGVGLRTVFQLSSPTTWPPVIDVARIAGDETTRAAHVVWYRDTANHDVHNSYRGADLAQDFHVFGVLWTRDEIAFYVDGVRTGVVPRPASTFVDSPLKFEIGGFAGLEGSDPPDATTPWPAYVTIDWIRAWRAL